MVEQGEKPLYIAENALQFRAFKATQSWKSAKLQSLDINKLITTNFKKQNSMEKPKKISDFADQALREIKLEQLHKQELLIDQKIKNDLVNAEMNLQKGMYQKAKTKTPYGVAAQYSKELVKCQFKLIVYWKVKPDGTPFSQFEIDNYENLKKIPSLDFDAYNRINHEVAYNKLLDKVYNEANRMNKAILVYMDYANSEEHWIANFNTTNLIHSVVRVVHFKEKDENGHIRFNYYEGEPIRLNQMRRYEK